MGIVNFFAEFWGLSLVIICLSLLVQPKHVKSVFEVADNETVLWWLGTFTVMLGIASVLAYNTWDSSPKVVITIVNWLVIIKGASYLFMPKTMAKFLAIFKHQYLKWLPAIMVIGVVLGCALIYLGVNF